jgi:hypothetical protein
MTCAFQMLAMIRATPPQAEQVSISTPNTRFRVTVRGTHLPNGALRTDGGTHVAACCLDADRISYVANYDIP